MDGTNFAQLHADEKATTVFHAAGVNMRHLGTSYHPTLPIKSYHTANNENPRTS